MPNFILLDRRIMLIASIALAVVGVGGLTWYLVANLGDRSGDDRIANKPDDVSASSNARPMESSGDASVANKPSDGAAANRSDGSTGSATERIESLLKDEPPIKKPAADLSALAGSWQGKIVAMEALSGNEAAALDVESTPPLSFTIQKEGGSYVMASADGQLPRRVLEAKDEKIRGQGSPPLVLAMEGDVLIGTVTNEHWRLEFHASRQP